MGAPSPPSTSTITNAATAGTQEQQALNTAAQYGSQYNQSNPYGSLSYTQTGVGPNGAPQYTATESLSPEQQQLYNQYTQTQTGAGSDAGNILNMAGYGTQSAANAIGNETSGLTGQFMNQWLAGTEPFFQTQSNQLQTQLANEGLGGPTNANPSGSPAYQNAMRQLQTNQGLAVAQQATTAENQAYNQALQTYMTPAQLGTSLASFAAPTTPNASFTTNTPAVQPANLAAMTTADTAAVMQPYEAQYQQYANIMNGLFGLGSAGITGLAKASDIRMKENISLIGRLPLGLGLYLYDYINGKKRQIGVMAQEVLKVKPEAVIVLPNGFLAVRYDRLLKEVLPMVDYNPYTSSSYQYVSNPGAPPQQQQPGQQKQDPNNPYAAQHIPGITGGLNDMFRGAMQGNPNLMANMASGLKNQFASPSVPGSPLNINPPNPTMSAIFSQPPATSSDTAIS